MKISAPLITASTLALAAASGCAMFHDERAHVMDKPCRTSSSAVCVVKVIVESCNKIKADPDHAKVKDTDRGDIEWELIAPSGWSFTDDGIKFKSAHRDFSKNRNLKNAYKWHNEHTEKIKRHRYTIEVTDGRQVCREDPSIMN